MPPGTQIRCSSRSSKATNISPNKSYTKHVHLHDPDDRLLQIDDAGVVVSEPLRSVLAHASEGAPGDNHGALLVRAEPQAARTDLRGSEQGVGVELGVTLREGRVKVDALGLQRFTCWRVGEFVHY